MGRALAVLLLIPLQVARGQDPPGVEPVGEYPSAMSVLSVVLIPKVIADVWLLREHVRGEEFARLRSAGGDLRAVDALYRRALRLSWNNTWEALLLCTLATLDHRRVGIRLAGFVLWFPLTSEFEEEFEARLRCLPVRLYADTPPGPAGDHAPPSPEQPEESTMRIGVGLPNTVPGTPGRRPSRGRHCQQPSTEMC